MESYTQLKIFNLIKLNLLTHKNARSVQNMRATRSMNLPKKSNYVPCENTSICNAGYGFQVSVWVSLNFVCLRIHAATPSYMSSCKTHAFTSTFVNIQFLLQVLNSFQYLSTPHALIFKLQKGASITRFVGLVVGLSVEKTVTALKWHLLTIIWKSKLLELFFRL